MSERDFITWTAEWRPDPSDAPMFVNSTIGRRLLVESVRVRASIGRFAIESEIMVEAMGPLVKKNGLVGVARRTVVWLHNPQHPESSDLHNAPVEVYRAVDRILRRLHDQTADLVDNLPS